MQTVSAAFQTACNATTRKPKQTLKIAWERNSDPAVVFAVVGTSTVDGNDIVQGELEVITPMDLFQFTDESDRPVTLGFDRRVQEPLGGIAYAVADLILQNTDKRFTPLFDGTIGNYILPNRPIKIYCGFDLGAFVKTIPVMYGLTGQPKEDKRQRVTKIQIFDYLSYINEYQLETAKYANQRSDQIIADILNTMGFGSDQYDLDVGLNVIDFTWFEKGTRAGNVICQLCEAEEGYFYQDEQGLLKFENRRHYNSAPHTVVQWTIGQDEILDWQEDSTVGIINRCIVKANPRTIVTDKEIYKLGEIIQLEHKETKTIWATFTDPCNAITDPVATTDYTVNSESNGTGTDVTAKVAIVMTKFATSAKPEVTNSSGGTAYITFLRLRGDPAVVLDPVEEMYEDTTSQGIYGVSELVVENNFIDDPAFAYYLARTLVRKYKDPLRRIRITVQAIPQLQLKDRISVQDPDTGDYTEYRIMGIQGYFEKEGFLMNLTLREISDLEADTPAIVGTSTVDDDTVVWI